MVGFGSSLRIGRRPGWEAAYLDYETLKLLLSQIESVYEEEGHHGQRAMDVNVFMGESDGDDDSSRKRKARDFRDELFLESDSDAAFASSHSNEEDVSNSDLSDYGKEKYRNDNRQNMLGQSQLGKDFNLIYSREDASSSSDDSYSGMEKNNCGGVPWRTEKPAAVTGKSQRKKNKSKQWYFEGREATGPHTFIMDEASESFDPADRQQYSSSLLNAPFQLGVSTESTALLSRSNQPQNVDSFFSFDHGNSVTFTPPRDFYSKEEITTNANPPQIMYGSSSVKTFLSAQKSSPNGLQPKSLKLEEERRRERRQRRRRKQARKRREREKRVPRHIRLAHSKSRAITERFLGLLRAEVEKITLFAQARLGELADTAGSLRFLSSEELTALSGTLVGRTKSTYEHQLSDGGIHPSASSSSDEGGAGQGLFPWSDSSSDDDSSQNSSRLNIPKNSSGGNLSQTESRTQRARSISPTKNLANEETTAKLKSTKRKIERFEDLRRKRPIFQRNDHIIGEDLLLISAVDEADAYCAVGVELLHILKYISVNVIAVRKICRKHDRLLMNRMLGSYHGKRTTRIQEEQTLGGLISSLELSSVNPTLGLADHGKLIGLYDLKIQLLANSRTVKAISSCLSLALSEYEVSRSRADALARLNSSARRPPAASVEVLQKRTEYTSSPLRVFNPRGWVTKSNDRAAAHEEHKAFGEDSVSDDESGKGPPSTSSTMSLTRLRYTVLSIAALREASRFKSDKFATYLSRTSLSFSGQAVIGEGLDGCSRETLDFFLCFCPDAALLLDSASLFEGLRRGKWRELSIGSVMRSSLAVALLNTTSHEFQPQKRYPGEEAIVVNAVSLLPQSEGINNSAPFEGTLLPISTSMSITRFVDFPPGFLRVNRSSLFLYTVNYFIGHATVNTFVLDTGANVAYSAAIVGAASFSAIIAAALHYNIFTKAGRSIKLLDEDFSLVRKFLAFSSIFGIVGNMVQIHGIRYSSILFCVFGRLLIGLSSADIVHRQVAASMPPSLVVPESARLVKMYVGGLITGLLLGSLAELLPFRTTVDPTMLLPVGSIGNMDGVKSIQVANWFMVFLWTIQFFRVICVGRGKTSPVEESRLTKMDENTNQGVTDALIEDQNGSDSSTSNGETGPAELFGRSEEIVEGGSNKGLDTNRDEMTHGGKSTRATWRSDVVADGRSRRKARRIRHFLKRIRRVVPYNITVAVALALTVYTSYTFEVLFTSCALIADQYFQWRGHIAGVFLGCLSVLILPIDYVCEQIARRYEERTTIRRSIVLLGIGLLVMVNWGSVFALAINVRNLLTETMDTRQHHYDWLLGIPQYTIGFSITFVGLRALSGASRSLLSKVSPFNAKGTVMNLGTVVTFVTLLSQFVADFQITMVGLSHRVINTDIVNALIVPMLIGCFVAYYFVKKHYFFLM